MTSSRKNLNQRGFTLQTIIIVSILALVAVLILLLLSRVVRDDARDISEATSRPEITIPNSILTDTPRIPIPKPDSDPTPQSCRTLNMVLLPGADECSPCGERERPNENGIRCIFDPSIPPTQTPESCLQQGMVLQMGGTQCVPCGEDMEPNAVGTACEEEVECAPGSMPNDNGLCVRIVSDPNPPAGPPTVLTPVVVNRIGAGENHTCVLQDSGRIRCVGRNRHGQLGNGELVNSPSFVEVSDITSAEQVSAGTFHSCARLAGGQVRCWGSNSVGQLGNGGNSDSPTPASAVIDNQGNPLARVVQIDSGGSYNCAITDADGDQSSDSLDDREVWCWGQGSSGQLGNGERRGYNRAVKAEGITAAMQVSVYRDHSCALMVDGTVRCWGRNNAGQLGNGEASRNAFSDTPVAVIDNDGSIFSEVEQVFVGGFHTCALMDGGEVRCWGDGGFGRLGNGPTNDIANIGILVPRPARVLDAGGSPITGVRQISAGATHTCALVSGGEVRCWGQNDVGQLGNGETNQLPSPVTQPDRHSSAPVAVITRVSGGFLSGIQGIAAGLDHTCAYQSASSIWCWGSDSDGQLGGVIPTHSYEPVEVAGGASDTLLSDVSQVSIGQHHSCALKENGQTTDKEVWCWGLNLNRRLGVGLVVNLVSTHSSATPVRAWHEWAIPPHPMTFRDFPLDDIPLLEQISVGYKHSCALFEDVPVIPYPDISRDEIGQVICWGDNNRGQLGPSNNILRGNLPEMIVGINEVSGVSSGLEHTCALLEDDPNTGDVDEGGRVMCWGFNGSGQLGNNRQSVATPGTPVTVVESRGASTPLTGAVQLSAGAEHTCALISGGEVRCWGLNVNRQLGIGENTASASAPRTVITEEVANCGNSCSPLTGVMQVSAGGTHSCGLLEDDTSTPEEDEGGQIWCWGSNREGQLGNNNILIGGMCCRQTSPIPVEVSGIDNARQVSAGRQHTCAVLATGRIMCWGLNSDGQLGNGDAVNRSTPTEVSGITNAVQVSAGIDHTCAVLTNETVRCWGSNSTGKLGNGVPTLSPVAVRASLP